MTNGPVHDVAIVIFGAAVRPDGRASNTLRRRVEAAAACGRRFRHPLFVPTGAVGRHGGSEASVMGGILRELGFAEDQLLLEETATDTLSSVRAVRRLLRRRSDRVPVLVATSAYHLPRCLMLMRLAGMPARACPPPEAPAAGRAARRWYWRLREVPALPYDAALTLGL
ncbi:MAG: YdcF family protein, partial [Rhodospirillales bacterium]|nr:YdcF family protein [Rhodospirillales bacterium]